MSIDETPSPSTAEVPGGTFLDQPGPTAAPRGLAAIAGVLAAAVALGTGELLSGISRRIPSLVAAVGDWVIDVAPGSVERWAIENLGTNNKPALVTGITVISLLIGAVTGMAAARRFRSAVIVFGAFAVIGGLAAAADTQRSAALGWAAAFVAAGVGLTTLWFLIRAAGSPDRDPLETELLSRRRAFVGAAGAAAAVGVASPLLGSVLRRRHDTGVETAREVIAASIDQVEQVDEVTVDTAEPAATSAPAVVGDFDDIEGVATLITPNDNFYRIDSALVVPRVDVETWSMKITGLVDTELEFTFDDLLAMDLVEEHVTLSCVSNRVGGELVGTAKWLGVPLKRLLDQAGVAGGATQIIGRSVDGWTGAFPVSYLDDPERVALVAVAMNDAPLPVRHGFPVRLVIAGLYGYVSATKWLAEVELAGPEFNGYWITRGWSRLGPIKTQSRIDVPRPNSEVRAGLQAVAGVAWAPDRGVDQVEVQITRVEDLSRGYDPNQLDGSWEIAELSQELSEESWRQWHLAWDPEPGDYVIRVRATDGTGETQTSEVSEPAPDGATGWHTRALRVTA